MCLIMAQISAVSLSENSAAILCGDAQGGKDLKSRGELVDTNVGAS